MSTLYQDNAALAASTDRGQVADMVLRLAAFQAIDLFRSGRPHAAERCLLKAASSADRILGGKR